MCYIIAKERDKHGCIALKTEHGKHLSQMVRSLNNRVKGQGIQLVTISRPTAYGEYAPYSFADNEEEFREKVLSMAIFDKPKENAIIK